MYMQALCYIRSMEQRSVPISEARANLTELVASVRLLRRCVFLTQRGRPRAAIVPLELGEAIEHAGGVEAALTILMGH